MLLRIRSEVETLAIPILSLDSCTLKKSHNSRETLSDDNEGKALISFVEYRELRIHPRLRGQPECTRTFETLSDMQQTFPYHIHSRLVRTSNGMTSFGNGLIYAPSVAYLVKTSVDQERLPA
jgi:hypothetical protein